MKGRLVRDKIPEIIKESGKIPITRIADEEEYKTALKEKLLEEVKEFNGSGDLEELADVLEVIHYLLQVEGSDMQAIEKIRKDKLLKRGSFSKKIILESVKK